MEHRLKSAETSWKQDKNAEKGLEFLFLYSLTGVVAFLRVIANTIPIHNRKQHIKTEAFLNLLQEKAEVLVLFFFTRSSSFVFLLII